MVLFEGEATEATEAIEEGPVLSRVRMCFFQNLFPMNFFTLFLTISFTHPTNCTPLWNDEWSLSATFTPMDLIRLPVDMSLGRYIEKLSTSEKLEAESCHITVTIRIGLGQDLVVSRNSVSKSYW